MKVLVCGGRYYRKPSVIAEVLGALHAEVPITRLIHGGAAGADTLGGMWATALGIPVDVYKADWHKHGRAAGPKRNTRMLVEGEPHLVVAFPGHEGTDNMVKQSYAKQKKTGELPFVLEVNETMLPGQLAIIAKVLAAHFSHDGKPKID